MTAPGISLGMTAALHAQTAPETTELDKSTAPVFDWLAPEHSDTAIRSRLAAVTPDVWDVHQHAVDLLSQAERRAIAELIAAAPTDLTYLLRRYDALLRYAAGAHGDTAWRAQQTELELLRADNARLTAALTHAVR